MRRAIVLETIARFFFFLDILQIPVLESSGFPVPVVGLGITEPDCPSPHSSSHGLHGVFLQLVDEMVHKRRQHGHAVADGGAGGRQVDHHGRT